MYEEITLDMLSKNSVSVKTQKYYSDGINIYPLGEPHRVGYVNSLNGRELVERDVSEPYKSSIFSMWGSEPTVEEPLI